MKHKYQISRKAASRTGLTKTGLTVILSLSLGLGVGLSLGACGNGSVSAPKTTSQSVSPQTSASSPSEAQKKAAEVRILARYLSSAKMTQQIDTANKQMGKNGSVTMTSKDKTVVMTVTLNNSLFGGESTETVKKNLKAKKDLFTDQYATIGAQIVKQIEKETKLTHIKLQLNIKTQDGQTVITKTYTEKSFSKALKNSQNQSE